MGFLRRAIAHVVACGSAQSCLGRLKTGGIQVGSGVCRRAKATSTVDAKNCMIVYRHIWKRQYECLKTSQSGKMRGEEEVTPEVWKVCLVAIHTVCPEPPCNFIDVLKGWGHTWI
jgi:hypothetical protein